MVIDMTNEKKIEKAAKKRIESMQNAKQVGELLRLFGKRELAETLLNIIEDGRIDYKNITQFPGFKEDFDRVIAAGLERRPEIKGTSADDIIEALAQLTIAGKTKVPLDPALSKIVAPIAEVAKSVQTDDSTLNDSLNAAMDIYLKVQNLVPGDFKAPQKFPHQGQNNWGDSKVAKNEKEMQKMKEESDKKEKEEITKKEEETRKKTLEMMKAVAKAADQASAIAEGKDTGQKEVKGKEKGEEEKPEWGNTPVNESRYPEWNRETEAYEDPRHKLVEKPSDARVWKGEELRHVVARIRKMFSMLKPQENEVARKQHDGDELDVDAYIQYLIDRRAGLSPEPAFFLRTNKNKRSVATLILVDMSGSTNSHVDGEKRRIDVEKEALLVTARAVEAIGDLLSICGFQSDGHDSRKTFFYNFKSFGNLRVQIPDLKPGESNRDGMAIRHATQKILATSAKLKVLMIISDGSPNDDGTEYTDRYAIEDTKKAVEEARKKGVRPFGIIIGRQDNEVFERIYGKDFINIKEITQLPDRLPVIYKRLTAG